VVAGVDVESTCQVVADGVLARAAAKRQLTDTEAVRVATSTDNAAQQTIQMLNKGGVEDRRVEDDDELFEVFAQDDARVESVSEKQTEHVVGETQQDVETVGVVRGVIQPTTERAEKQSDGVVTERIDHVRISAVTTQHSNTRLHLQHSTAQSPHCLPYLHNHSFIWFKFISNRTAISHLSHVGLHTYTKTYNKLPQQDHITTDCTILDHQIICRSQQQSMTSTARRA